MKRFNINFFCSVEINLVIKILKRSWKVIIYAEHKLCIAFGQYLSSISLTCALSCSNHHSTTVKTDIQTLLHTSCPLSPSVIYPSIHQSILSPFLLAVSYCIVQGSLELTILSPLASKALWWQLCTTTGSLSFGLYLWDHAALILPFCTWLIWMSMLPYSSSLLWK